MPPKLRSRFSTKYNVLMTLPLASIIYAYIYHSIALCRGLSMSLRITANTNCLKCMSFPILLKCTKYDTCVMHRFHIFVDFLRFSTCYVQQNMIQNVNEYDQEMPQSQTTNDPTAPRVRDTSHDSKTKRNASFLFLCEMIAILERTLNTALQKLTKHKKPTNDGSSNKPTTTTDPLPIWHSI